MLVFQTDVLSSAVSLLQNTGITVVLLRAAKANPQPGGGTQTLVQSDTSCLRSLQRHMMK